MKLSTTLALTACAGIVAFALGNRTQRETDPETAGGTQRSASLARPLPPRGSRDAVAAEAVRAMGKYAACSKEFSADNAAKLTSKERLELLANGARVGDYGNQAAMLCGLISVLTKQEILDAANLLDAIQDQGNRQAPEVWQSLWQQWGRLDPRGCLVFFDADDMEESPIDARNVMTGWLETDADSALAWAQEPEKTPLEAAAAALAISRSVNGDLQQLESAILKLPAGEETSRVCLEDYFDLASLAGKDQTAVTIYQNLPPALRPAAWTVAAKRIGYGDSGEAKAWLTEHAADPGRNYDALSDLFNSLAHEDPAGAVRWAVQLPYSAASDTVHPALLPVARWRQRDPVAAEAWMRTQPQDAPWISREAY